MIIDTHIIINQMQMFASLIVIGIVIQRTGLLTDENITHFSALLTKFIFPCMLLTMVPNSGTREMILQSAKFMAAAFGYIAMMILLSFGIAQLMGFRDKARRRMHVIISSYGNAGFIGVPLCNAVFPQLGIGSAMYTLIEAVFCWGLGPVIADPNSRFDRKNLKNLVTPLTIAILIGFLLTALDIHPAGFIPWDTISAIGATTKYFACFYIGLNLGRIGFARVFTEKRVFFSSIVKLFVFPVLMYCIVRPMHIMSEDMLGVLLIMACTPTGMAMPLLAEIAGGDKEYAVAGTMVNTILCLFTIPLVCWFCTSVIG